MLGEEASSPEIEEQQQDRERVVRLNRGLVRGWRGGGRGVGEPRTPTPSWKLYENPSYEGLAAAVAAATEAAARVAAGAMQQGKKRGGGGDMAGRIIPGGGGASVAAKGGGIGEGGSSSSSSSISARKLVASLWEELQEIPVSSRARPPPAAFLLRRFPPPPLLDPSDASPCSHLQSRPSSLSTSDSPNIDPSKPPAVPRKNQHPPTGFVVNTPMKTIAILRPNASEDSIPRRKSVSRSRATYASPLGMDVAKQLVTLADSSQLCEAGPPTSPRDYVKSINRLRHYEEQHDDNSADVSALCHELELARARVQELEAALKSAGKEMEGFLKRCSDERMMLRNREQEKVRVAVFSIGEELEGERKARKKLEVQNRKLLKNLSDTNKRAVRAMEELEDERKARRLMEDVCDELAREIGEDNAEVEELKRGHAKAKEEIEEERRMLQMAEVWREERVQMKLSAARLELEENCMAVNNMRADVEEFLSSRRTSLEREDFQQQVESNQAESLQEALEKLQARTAVSMRVIEESTNHSSEPDDTGSSEEIHSLHVPREQIRAKSIRLQDPNVYQHFDSHDHVWTNRRHSSRRRNQGALRSYTSRPQELNRMGDRDVEVGNFQDDVYRAVEFETEEPSVWECASDIRCDERGEESNWSADYDDDDEIKRDDRSSWQCGSDEEEETSRSPQQFRSIMYSLSDTPVRMKGGRGGGAVDQSIGVTHIVCTTGAAGEEDPLMSSDVFYVEDCESIAGYSPTLRARKGVWSLEVPANDGPTQGRRSSVSGARDWSKPFRNNSLQAMLLEDRMNSPQFQPRRVRGKPKRR